MTDVEDEAASPKRPARSPVVRWILRLPQGVYAALIVGVLILLVLVTVAINPGERVGPVRPADPPVGGPGLPAARL